MTGHGVPRPVDFPFSSGIALPQKEYNNNEKENI
jgi:hypothetical protein